MKILTILILLMIAMLMIGCSQANIEDTQKNNEVNIDIQDTQTDIGLEDTGVEAISEIDDIINTW